MSKHLLSRSLALLSLVAILLSACSAAQAPRSEQPQIEKVEVEGAPAAPAADFAYQSSEGGQAFLTSDIAPQTERIVLKDAQMSIVVDDPAASMDTISAMAEEMGGFVVSANLYQDRLESGADVPRASVTVRVPAERFNEAIERIRAESDRLPLNEDSNSQDVTREYTDLQSRVRNLEAAEEQLTEIMGSATKTEDVLAVYNRLVEVREQIEVIQGQIKYYEQSAALSAISVELIANEAVQPLSIGGWQPVGVAKNAVQALINTGKFIANAAIWIIIYILPTLAILYVVFVLPLSLVWRAVRRRRAKRKIAPAAEGK